jgi:hypothetical protein
LIHAKRVRSTRRRPPDRPIADRPRRFYAKVTLDPNRPTPQVSNIAQSILSELDRARGTTITLTLDIDAETGDGFPEDVESIVRDNAASLRISDFGFRGGVGQQRGAAVRPATRFWGREDQFPIPIQSTNDSRPRWLASASAPDLPVADLVAGRVPRNRSAALWGTRCRHRGLGYTGGHPQPYAAIRAHKDDPCAQLEFAPQGAHILARQYPADDAELEFSTENTGRLGPGHGFSY